MKTALARGVFLAASVIFLEPALSAQTFGNLYVGYSFLSNDVHVQKQIGESGTPTATGRGNLNGWNVSGEVKVFRWIGVVADFDGNYGSAPETGLDPLFFKPPTYLHTTFYSYLFGPRVSVEIGRIRPFAEALVGAASQHVEFTSFESADDKHLATAYGGGIDYRLSKHFGWRLEGDYVGSRLFRGLQSGFTTPVQHNFRFSTGLLFRL